MKITAFRKNSFFIIFILLSVATSLTIHSNVSADVKCVGDDMTFTECNITCMSIVGNWITIPPYPYDDWSDFCRGACKDGLELLDGNGNTIIFNIKKCTNVKKLKDNFCLRCSNPPCNGGWNLENADICRFPCEMCSILSELWGKRCKKQVQSRMNSSIPDEILNPPIGSEQSHCPTRETITVPGHTY